MIDYKLEDWLVLPESNELVLNDHSVKLESRIMEVLIYFCENPLRVIGRDELIEAVWGKVALSPNSINVAIGVIRQVLGDNAKNPTYLETVQKRGYRLLIEPQIVDSDLLFQQPILKGYGSINILKRIGLMVGLLVMTYVSSHLITKPFDASTQRVMVSLVGIENDTGDTEYDQLSTSLGDLLIVEVAQNIHFRVRKARSHQSLIVNDVSPSDYTENLTLTGKLIKADGQLRLAIFLRDVGTSEVRWATTQDINNGLSFESVSKLAKEMFNGFGFHKKKQSNETAQVPVDPNHLKAKELVDRALYLWGFHGDQMNQVAFNLVNRAINISPDYGPAHGLLSLMYVIRGLEYWGLEGNKFDEAMKKVRLARELGADESFLLLTQAQIELYRDRRPDLAKKSLNKAYEINPSNPWVFRYMTVVNQIHGQFEAALNNNIKATSLSVDPVGLLFERQFDLYFLGRYDEMQDLYDKTIEFDGRPTIMGVLGLSLDGKDEEALKGWIDYLNIYLEADSQISYNSLIVLKESSKKEAYEALLKESDFSIDSTDFFEPSVIAMWNIEMGEKQDALRALKIGVDLYMPFVEVNGLANLFVLLHVDPYFSSLRNTPEMIEIMDTIGITKYVDINNLPNNSVN